MQHARLLGAAVAAVDELGWQRVTVAHIATRARVSRRTFYDLFDNRDECLLAVLEDTVGRIERELARTVRDGASWVERVRIGLWTMLGFFDRERALARVFVVQSARGGQRVLEAREESMARLAAAIAEGNGEGSRARGVPPLVAEGLVGAAVSIVYKRLLKGERAPLADLQAELMGMIVLPYLGASAASKERKRPTPKPLLAGDASPEHGVRREDALAEVPMRLTYRTARVLEVAVEYPGASNRVIGEQAGVFDQGQVSKLLSRLQRLGLLQNTGVGHAKGERNAWRLTPLGRRVVEQLSLGTRFHAAKEATR
ncbi:MAG TPA: TetR/AcrR family transcriptional regulator [Solirubrobacteraceae bacterium]|jgi:AcrR family transcriptional regulator/DNA-binding MarR family transcriptional regulator